MPDDPHAQLELLGPLAGSWTTEGSHPLLPGTALTGQATFEWLEGGRFLIWRSHADHPEIPDAVAVLGVTDDRLSMHYFDTRGVFRVYSVDAAQGDSPLVWRFWRDDPGFSQRFTGTFDQDGDTFTTRGQFSRDGQGWEDDLALTYRRVP